MKILSYIVPIYKVEAVLKRCIDSLYLQDFSEEEFEVIAVDDGSPDKSGDICKEYQTKHSNFTYIRQENQGLGGARNTGLIYASGKYIAFIDSDDQLVPHSIRKVVQIAEQTRCEMCFFLSKFCPDTGEIQNRQPFEKGKAYSGEYALLHGMNVSSVWSNIYLSDFLKNSGIKFIPGIYHEDVPFNYCLYPFAKSMVFTDVLCYIYTQDVESITHTKNPLKRRKSLLAQALVMSEIRDFVSSHAFQWSDSLNDYFHRLIASVIGGTLLSSLFNKKYSYDTVKTFLNECIAKGLYPVVRPTRSSRLDLFIPFINCRRLYLLIAKICLTNT